MKRKLVIGGSMGVVVLMIIGTIPTLASEQTWEISNPIQHKINIIQQVKNIILNEQWFPGQLIIFLINIIIFLLISLIWPFS